jgi:hypothetical protein
MQTPTPPLAAPAWRKRPVVPRMPRLREGAHRHLQGRPQAHRAVSGGPWSDDRRRHTYGPGKQEAEAEGRRKVERAPVREVPANQTAMHSWRARPSRAGAPAIPGNGSGWRYKATGSVEPSFWLWTFTVSRGRTTKVTNRIVYIRAFERSDTEWLQTDIVRPTRSLTWIIPFPGGNRCASARGVSRVRSGPWVDVALNQPEILGDGGLVYWRIDNQEGEPPILDAQYGIEWHWAGQP